MRLHSAGSFKVIQVRINSAPVSFAFTCYSLNYETDTSEQIVALTEKRRELAKWVRARANMCMHVVLFVVGVLFRWQQVQFCKWMTACNSFMWLCMYLWRQTIHTDNPAQEQILGIGTECSSSEAKLRTNRPVAGHGRAEGTEAELIMDSESSTGLWGRDYYEFGHWQWGHYRGEKNKY